MSNPFNNGPPDNGGGIKDGFSTTAAGMLAMIFGPIVHQHSYPFVEWFALQTYPRDIVSIFEFVWMIACFPLVYFASKASILYALTAAGIYLAYRFI